MRNRWLFVALAVAFASCKKEKDEDPALVYRSIEYRLMFQSTDSVIIAWTDSLANMHHDTVSNWWTHNLHAAVGSSLTFTARKTSDAGYISVCTNFTDSIAIGCNSTSTPFGTASLSVSVP